MLAVGILLSSARCSCRLYTTTVLLGWEHALDGIHSNRHLVALSGDEVEDASRYPVVGRRVCATILECYHGGVVFVLRGRPGRWGRLFDRSARWRWFKLGLLRWHRDWLSEIDRQRWHHNRHVLGRWRVAWLLIRLARIDRRRRGINRGGDERRRCVWESLVPAVPAGRPLPAGAWAPERPKYRGGSGRRSHVPRKRWIDILRPGRSLAADRRCTYARKPRHTAPHAAWPCRSSPSRSSNGSALRETRQACNSYENRHRDRPHIASPPRSIPTLKSGFKTWSYRSVRGPRAGEMSL
jgi:hypothetical protein